MIPFAILVDLVAGEPLPDLEVIESHLLGCADCSQTVEELLATTRGIADLLRAGGMRLIATEATVARLRAEKVSLREHRIAPGKVVPCSIGAHERYALTGYELPSAVPARVDFLLLAADGSVAQRLEDVPVDRSSGMVWSLELGERVRQVPSMSVRMRLVGVSADGSESPLGDYGLDHTAFVG